MTSFVSAPCPGAARCPAFFSQGSIQRFAGSSGFPPISKLIRWSSS